LFKLRGVGAAHNATLKDIAAGSVLVDGVPHALERLFFGYFYGGDGIEGTKGSI
jgi:hypothetical protein